VLARLHLALLKVYRRLPVRGRRFVVRRVAPSFSVGAICIIERSDGALLLVRHSYRKRWGFPGGLLARGEGPPEAAVREAREEVGLAVALVGEPTVVVDPEPRRVDVIFRARPADGADPASARPSSPEIVDARWFPQRELPELQHEAAGALVALARRDRDLAPDVSGAADGESSAD
jgi:8-oxo-dGTP pyrophosphatase MutT (NUDIX family)